MEGGRGAGGGGRYRDKGGQQVGSLFAEASDNEKIKAVYGNYNLWSWLRYWFLDTENYITFMLLDKGYYDYDYEKPDKRTEAALSAVLSDSELEEKLRGMGFVVKPRKTLSPEELQAEVLGEEHMKTPSGAHTGKG